MMVHPAARMVIISLYFMQSILVHPLWLPLLSIWIQPFMSWTVSHPSKHRFLTLKCRPNILSTVRLHL